MTAIFCAQPVSMQMFRLKEAFEYVTHVVALYNSLSTNIYFLQIIDTALENITQARVPRIFN